MTEVYDVAVIGGGPAGYSAAIRAGQLGLKTLLIEKNEIGGTCLNVGCIPTKHFVHYSDVFTTIQQASKLGIKSKIEGTDLNVFQREKTKLIKQLKSGIEGILLSQNVELKKGTGKIEAKDRVLIQSGDQEETVTARRIIVATGSSPAILPSLPFDGQKILSSDDVLNLTELPDRLAIIGGGVIGIEFASVFSKLGVEVHVVEALPSILMAEDEDIVRYLKTSLERKGVRFYENTSFKNHSSDGSQLELTLDHAGQPISLTVDLVLVAIGRTRNNRHVGLEQMGVEMNGSAVEVNDYMQTTVSTIYSVGDINPGYQLAHVAFEEGIVAAEHIAGLNRKMSYAAIPRCIYASPEISTVGMTEKEAREHYPEVEVYTFPLGANAKSLMAGKKEGIAKVTIEGTYKEILGMSLVGEGVNELIAEGALAIYLEATVEELGDLIHPHPSLSEIVKEVALVATGKPLHIAKQGGKTHESDKRTAAAK